MSDTPPSAPATPAAVLRRHGPVTVTLLAVNVLVWAWQVLRGVGWLSPTLDDLAAWGANVWVFTLTGDWWRLGTSMFLHGGVIHLVLNMLSLAMAGERTEHEFGRPRMLAIYLAGGLVSSCASTVWRGLQTLAPVAAGHAAVSPGGAGASGAIMALIGALFAAAALGMPESDGSVHKPIFDTNLAMVIAFSIITGVFIPGIDQVAHVGGLVGGFAIGAILGVASTRRGLVATALRTFATLAVVGACLAAVAQVGHRTQFRGLRIQMQLEQAVRAHDAQTHGPQGPSGHQGGQRL